MEHQAHISDKSDQSIGIKVLVAIVVAVAIVLVGAYIMHGSSL